MHHDEIILNYLKMCTKKQRQLIKSANDKKAIEALKIHEDQIILFGAGIVGKRMLSLLESIGTEVVGFCDNNEDIIGKIISGKNVYSLKGLLDMKEDYIWFISVKSEHVQREIEQQLKDNGITNIVLSLEELLFGHLIKEYELQTLDNNRQGLLLFGAGRYGRRYANSLKKYGIEIDGFVDNSQVVIGTKVAGKDVMTLNEAKSKFKDIVWLISIKNDLAKKEIKDNLHSEGFSCIAETIPDLLDIIDKAELKPFFEEHLSVSQSPQQQNISTRTDFNQIGREILQRQQNEFSRLELSKRLSKFDYTPLISVIVPMYNPPMEWLPRVVQSLQEQIYGKWELCICDDGSPEHDGIEYIKEVAKYDNRIKLVENIKNGGISKASNSALGIALGEYIALLDQDDELPKDAFFWIVERLNVRPDTDFIYTDECKYNSNAIYQYFDFYLKPDWSPRLLMNHMYTGHLSVYKTDIVRRVGGFRSLFDFSQDYDLALRVSSITNKIEHVERILYYWRAIETSAATGAKDFARVTNMNALKEWYNLHNIDVVMQMMPRGNYGRVNQVNNIKVSIIIPTDNYTNLSTCIHGLMENTSYGNIEIIPVTNSTICKQVVEEFMYLGSTLRPCPYDEPFNFSKKCNQGAMFSEGDVLLFYNDDVTPITHDWIERLTDLLILPDVGSVSPMLTDPDGKIQYAGMITGTPGLIGTAFNGYLADQYQYAVFNHLLLRDVSVLSGACCVVKRNLFNKIGGFDEIYTPNGHSDVDLSFKILDAGFYNVYTPYARLVHLGNHTWHAKEDKDLSDIYCLNRWGKYLHRDAMFTDSQKKMFYFDFPYTYKIFPVSYRETENQKNILFVTHELSLTGAPRVLLSVVKYSIEIGYTPFVISFKEGPLKDDYHKMGVTVIIDESSQYCPWIFERFATNFDVVFVNTIVSYNVINILNNSKIKVYWWLHEGSFGICEYKENLPLDLGSNINIIFCGPYVENMFKKLGINYSGKVLWHSVEDYKNNSITNKLPIMTNRFTFLFVASIERRKGIDIFIKAIDGMNKQLSKDCQFIIIGANYDDNLMQYLMNFANKESNITIMAPMPHEEVQRYYEVSDIFVIPSRDDPGPVVATEAMMHSLPVICSNMTGVSYLIKNNYSGFVFENENSQELAELMNYVVLHKEDMAYIGKNGRLLYEQYFAEHILESAIKELLKD